MQDAAVNIPAHRAEPVVVTRPEPGLARGLFEAPPAFFVVVAALAALGFAVAFALRWRKKR